MAEQAQQLQTPMKAPFPAPPPFYKHFTPDNLTSLRRLRKEAGLPTQRTTEPSQASNAPQSDIDILSLPSELRFLIPPPPPASDQPFHAFGWERSLAAPAPTLAEVGIPQLYPDHPAVKLNPQAHLISLARSQLTTFLALVGNMSQNPSEGWEDKTKDLEELMYNTVDLMNQYRPHQARETLISSMEERVAKMRREMEQIAALKVRVGEAMGGLVEDAGAGEGMADVNVDGKDGNQDGLEAKRKERQRAAWATLEKPTAEDG